MSPSPTGTPTRTPAQARPDRLPWSPLLALATASFLVILTEALPAGVLPEMARGLGVGESAMGQSLTLYALATGLSAIPVLRVTAAWNRRTVLLVAVAAFTLADAVTAVSSSYPLTMALRVVAGVAAAVVWIELPGYARRLAPPRLQGRATAVAMAGVPAALSVGIPLGTLLGHAVGWRPAFAAVAAISLLLAAWLARSLPDAHQEGRQGPVLRALRLPGVPAVLFVVAAYVLAHNVLYTYIAAFLDGRGLGDARGAALTVLGLASLLGILVTGALIDRALRGLTVAAVGLFLLAAALLAVPGLGAPATYAAMALWGLGWGGVSTLLPTAVANAGGDPRVASRGEVEGGGGPERGTSEGHPPGTQPRRSGAESSAQALLVTTWNTSMGLGGAAGGLLLGLAGASAFPWCVLALLAPALVAYGLSSPSGRASRQ